MLCSSCKDKPINRGIKTIKCSECGTKRIINSAYGNSYDNVCSDCSDKWRICINCSMRKEVIIDYVPKGDEVIYFDEERKQLIKSLSKILKKLNYSFEIK